MAATVEIQGLDKLQETFRMLPSELRPVILQAVARKAATPIVREARHLVPQDTGKTAKSVGVLRVRNRMQPYVEVGFKGKSLGYIYLTGAKNRHTKKGAYRGDIEKIPNPFHRAADHVGENVKKEMNLDLSKVIARALRKRGYTVR